MNEKEQEVLDVQGTENAVETTEATYKSICNKIIADGARRLRNLKVKTAKVTEQDNYVMVSMTLEKKVKGYVADEDGVFSEGMTNVIFGSSYSIAGCLKQDEDLAFVANKVVEEPKSLELLLAGSEIDLIQQDVAAGEMYKNPFSTNNAEGIAFDHDTVINHIVAIKPGRRAMAVLDRVALAMFGL